ncbi:MAG: hypothetical protein RR662_07195 [Clostridia bacterium]
MLNLDIIIKQAEEKLKENSKNYEAFKIYALAKLLNKENLVMNTKMVENKEIEKITCNTEFEKVMLELPKEKIEDAIYTLSEFVESIKIINNKTYEMLIMQLKELI